MKNHSHAVLVLVQTRVLSHLCISTSDSNQNLNI
jgi:hypothetical protein